MNDSIIFDLDSSSVNHNTTAELEFPEESLEELLARSNLIMASAASKIRKNVPVQLQTVTLRELTEIPSSNPVPTHNLNESDDDVIFVGEETNQTNVVVVGDVINLCSPSKGPTSRLLPVNENSRFRNEDPTTQNIVKPVAAVPKDTDRQENTVICAVCMDSSVGKQPHSTNCGHIFCGACIKESIKIRKKCPLCNKNLSVKNIFPVFI